MNWRSKLDLPASQSKKAPESFPGALPSKSTNQSFFSNGPGGTQPVRGSFIVGTGGGEGNRTPVRTSDGSSATCLV